MSTISIPLNAQLEQGMEKLIAEGVADNKASFVRKAIEKFIEQTIIDDIREAEQELKEKKYLHGSIRELSDKIHGKNGKI